MHTSNGIRCSYVKNSALKKIIIKNKNSALAITNNAAQEKKNLNWLYQITSSAWSWWRGRRCQTICAICKAHFFLLAHGQCMMVTKLMVVSKLPSIHLFHQVCCASSSTCLWWHKSTTSVDFCVAATWMVVPVVVVMMVSSVTWKKKK